MNVVSFVFRDLFAVDSNMQSYRKTNRIYNQDNNFSGKEVMAMLYGIREHGQGMVEYAFLFLLIALIVIAVLLLLGPTIGNVFSNLNSKMVTY